MICSPMFSRSELRQGWADKIARLAEADIHKQVTAALPVQKLQFHTVSSSTMHESTTSGSALSVPAPEPAPAPVIPKTPVSPAVPSVPLSAPAPALAPVPIVRATPAAPLVPAVSTPSVPSATTAKSMPLPVAQPSVRKVKHCPVRLGMPYLHAPATCRLYLPSKSPFTSKTVPANHWSFLPMWCLDVTHHRNRMVTWCWLFPIVLARYHVITCVWRLPPDICGLPTSIALMAPASSMKTARKSISLPSNDMPSNRVREFHSAIWAVASSWRKAGGGVHDFRNPTEQA